MQALPFELLLFMRRLESNQYFASNKYFDYKYIIEKQKKFIYIYILTGFLYQRVFFLQIMHMSGKTDDDFFAEVLALVDFFNVFFFLLDDRDDSTLHFFELSSTLVVCSE